MQAKQQKMLRLVESGLMLAMATALSMVKVLDLPYGGSITACSALPILLVGYRHGLPWGLLTAFAHSLLQLVLGAGTLGHTIEGLEGVTRLNVCISPQVLVLPALPLWGWGGGGGGEGRHGTHSSQTWMKPHSTHRWSSRG